MLAFFDATSFCLGVGLGVFINFVLELFLPTVVGLALFFGGRAGFEGGGCAVFAAGEGSCLEGRAWTWCIIVVV